MARLWQLSWRRRLPPTYRHDGLRRSLVQLGLRLQNWLQRSGGARSKMKEARLRDFNHTATPSLVGLGRGAWGHSKYTPISISIKFLQHHYGANRFVDHSNGVGPLF